MKIKQIFVGAEISIGWALRDRPWSQILHQVPAHHFLVDCEQASANLSVFNSKMG